MPRVKNVAATKDTAVEEKNTKATSHRNENARLVLEKLVQKEGCIRHCKHLFDNCFRVNYYSPIEHQIVESHFVSVVKDEVNILG